MAGRQDGAGGGAFGAGFGREDAELRKKFVFGSCGGAGPSPPRGLQPTFVVVELEVLLNPCS